jgi:hypothetical protein
MPTASDVATALSKLRLTLKPGEMFSNREVAQQIGGDDDATALAVARMLSGFPHVEPKTLGAGAHPDGLWGFI